MKFENKGLAMLENCKIQAFCYNRIYYDQLSNNLVKFSQIVTPLFPITLHLVVIYLYWYVLYW